MSREMLINVTQGEECRVAVLKDGALEELYMEREDDNSCVNNIYLGKVINVESSIQAAFVDYGEKRHGFLHISDIHPRYYVNEGAKEKIGKRTGLKKRPPIRKCIKPGQKIVVQVIKEGVGTKGPAVTTYLSLPGKYLVLMPWMNKVGVSQRIENEESRKRLKGIISELEGPEDAGFIIRTAGELANKRDIQMDLKYLTRLWESIKKRMNKRQPPAELYRESDLAIRAVRDVFNTTVKRVVCDSETVTNKIKDFFEITQPRYKKRISFYNSSEPLFHKYWIEEAVNKVKQRKVELRGGGTIVIEQTEALVAIDVNSARAKKFKDIEQTALQTNIEAAKEIARQLRLRDMGGIIVCDFIDMEKAPNRRRVEKEFRDAVKPDRAKYRILRMSQFCLVEMTRQRMRPSLERSLFRECPLCGGSGLIKCAESVAVEILREVQIALANKRTVKVLVETSAEIAEHLLNSKRAVICEAECESEKGIEIRQRPEMKGEEFTVSCLDERGRMVL
ncbi:Ribonuclease E [Sedimentisphaera cyanobacteriorum]|uniref:Ribonuclease G n=1 Tax=Sedimentisphaera cyanobacteriorum TaxID=1940790 RepID=A0A1Q2HQA1_9BACT|nr:Rne/Rng family ribonuclease [Sedimentisphaera cyanobacteriorum]AQQ09501.1 Ribonuclease E [Sedimentisphaera cyanobacteriorum]